MISTFKRHEKKYIISKKQYEDFLSFSREKLEFDEHCTNGKCYVISNIYFDTKANDVIRNSISHPKYKEKLRIRKYGLDSNDYSIFFLEMKKKYDGTVAKRRVALSYNEMIEFMETLKRPVKLNYLENQILDEIEYYLNHNLVYPMVYMNYDRIAYIGKDEPNLRITFDTNIITRRENIMFENIKEGNRQLSDDEILLEIKFENAIPLWLTNILSNLDIKATKYSKYGKEYEKYAYEKANKKNNERGKEAC